MLQSHEYSFPEFLRPVFDFNLSRKAIFIFKHKTRPSPEIAKSLKNLTLMIIDYVTRSVPGYAPVIMI